MDLEADDPRRLWNLELLFDFGECRRIALGDADDRRQPVTVNQSATPVPAPANFRITTGQGTG
jgi:hypothetical protein